MPTIPPFLLVEVLSPEDRLVRLQPEIQDYLAYGVEWIWVIDPDERRALSSSSNPGGMLVSELGTEKPELVIPLLELFSVLDA